MTTVRPHRKATEEIHVAFDSETYRLLKEASLRRHEPVAAIIRRAVDRMLRVEAADAGAQVLAEAVRGVLREELRPVRRLAYLAAFEAAAAHKLSRNTHGDVLTHMKVGREAIAQRVDALDTDARRWAANRSRDPEPADPMDAAPALPLPKADEEIDLGAS